MRAGAGRAWVEFGVGGGREIRNYLCELLNADAMHAKVT